jgi:hypothetical protein
MLRDTRSTLRGRYRDATLRPSPTGIPAARGWAGPCYPAFATSAA